MKIKTNELTGAALDWAVAKCEGSVNNNGRVLSLTSWAPSTDWAQGGPIIEREKIELRFYREWCGDLDTMSYGLFGPTPLIAAMRCYVASKLGDEVEVPEELS